MMIDNRCIFCNVCIPEGIQVCASCEHDASLRTEYNNTTMAVWFKKGIKTQLSLKEWEKKTIDQVFDSQLPIVFLIIPFRGRTHKDILNTIDVMSDAVNKIYDNNVVIAHNYVIFNDHDIDQKNSVYRLAEALKIMSACSVAATVKGYRSVNSGYNFKKDIALAYGMQLISVSNMEEAIPDLKVVRTCPKCNEKVLLSAERRLDGSTHCKTCGYIGAHNKFYKNQKR